MRPSKKHAATLAIAVALTGLGTITASGAGASTSIGANWERGSGSGGFGGFGNSAVDFATITEAAAFEYPFVGVGGLVSPGFGFGF
ncbi:hypothetical protein ABGB17_03925 [Sphaerisporangium sp. B11E5]|uniref:hypothetical protein n=1 Tax=Sphaerisporangium sp. B11E5 TaxID=3153563 RepID=UPI00325D3955